MNKVSNTIGVMNRVRQLMDDRKHNVALELIEKQLEMSELSLVSRDFFLYRKGIALDCTGKTFEALEIFLSLHEKHPYSAQYLMSLRIVLRGIAIMTMDLIKSKPSSDLIRQYEEILVAIDACPSLIRLHTAVQRALDGDVEYALKLVEAYLELSPNDSDYLITAVRVAEIANDHKYRNEILRRIRVLVDRYPHTYQLVEFLHQQEVLKAS